ncbi:hypothetical protein TPHA_0P01790 [Tetrapisispora phaffii CBS 4417]|uniref:P/Homo B domain-containing protein n=1 Tax=Tetrapisispora phaffii (strain ATCC 24235 / CBS 4417 / NBRC 1672 / NRRL Y-8282 / UCD 70-5) TaxID=1071381 RepID=G8C2F8_TETPH|nr:hypothetical protein TPHA_0P01790 [Tetrapisispora phaffii CBS 4417]CCE66336.1 hypothetical protein TPHA_0P01790 [Tetrapisispora phaffii CBS 4417]
MFHQINVLFILIFLFIFKSAISEKVPEKNHNINQYFAIESHLSADDLLKLHSNWKFEHNVRGLENHYVFSKKYNTLSSPIQKREDLSSLEGVSSFHDLPPITLQKRQPIPVPPIDSSLLPLQEAANKLGIKDPLFSKQWHLINPSFPGNDVNVSGVWFSGITGKGVVAAIVDDGLDHNSEDLKDNFCEEGSWDFNENKKLPTPKLIDDYHGTRCAGEIAAVKNEYCGLGVAYGAKVAGIRILSGQITAEDEAASLMYGLDINDIFSCSWGPPDDGKHLQGPSDLVKKAMIKGTQEGRNEKGSIYVFASGNGGHYGDNCNYDGYTNSIYSITIGAIDHKGLHPPYSESCSAVLAVTYSSGSGEYIHSTDIKSQCSDRHGGTSAAAPLAAGIYALVLEANPELTWRDVQYLSILSSVEVPNPDAEWRNGALNKRYSHRYGYGKIDSFAIVELAKTWKNVKPQSWYYHKTARPELTSNSIDKVLEHEITITKKDLTNANLKRVEHITVTVDIEATRRGAVVIDLISPSGMISNLGVQRSLDVSSDGFINWTFMSVAHWGEEGVGKWKLRVRTVKEENEIKFHNWRLKIFGESINPEKATKFVFGNDKELEELRTSSTTSIIQSSTTVSSTSTPSKDVLPSSSITSSLLSTSSSTIASISHTTSSTLIPSETNDAIDSDLEADLNTPNKLDSPKDFMHYFLSIFSFGCVLLALYYFFFLNSKRRIRRSRAETYEFDIIDSDSDFDETSESINGGDDFVIDDTFDFDLSDEDAVPLTTNVQGIDEQLSESNDITKLSPHSSNNK